MKHILFASAFLFVANTTPAAILTMQYEQVGNDVVLTTSGGYDNLNGLVLGSPAGTTTSSGVTSGSSSTYLYSGADNSAIISISGGYTLNRVGGDIISTGANTGSSWADVSGVSGNSALFIEARTSGTIALSLAYDSGNTQPFSSVAFSGSSTWNSQTLAGLGLDTGTYEIRWDSGNQGIDIVVIPEPSSFLLIGLSGLLLLRRQR